jgi:hypothetical protein
MAASPMPWTRPIPRLASAKGEASRARRPGHKVGRLAFGLEDDRAGRIDQQFQQHDVHRQQQRRPVQQRGDQRQQDHRHVHREHKPRGVGDVVVDAPALADGAHDAGEAVVQQHQCGGLARHVGAALAHGHADVGGFQGRGVIDAVTGHRDDFTALLQQMDQAQLLLGLQARAQVDLAQPGAQGVVAQRGDLGAGQHGGAVAQAHLPGDGAGGGRVVAGHHDHAHAGGAAFGQRGWHVGARRVHEGDQAEEAEREVVLAGGPTGRGGRIVRAGSITRLAAPLRRASRDAEHTQAAFGHRQHFGGDGVAFGQRQVAQVHHGFGRALGGQQVLIGPLAGKHQRHGQDVRREGIGKRGCPVGVHVFGAFQPVPAELLDGFFHRIERVGGRGEHREFSQRVKGLGQAGGTFGAEAGAARAQFSHLHDVLRQRAGLVGGQHGDGAQRLDR